MKPRVELIVYRGIKFRRYPDSPHQSDRRYYKPAANHRKNGVGALHQEVWKDHHGQEIPAGHHVHHADHDVDNNAPENLVLVPSSDHIKHHMAQPDRREHARRAIVFAQEAAKEWHASEEGRAWHVEHGRRTWEGREPVTYTCEQCGGSYESLKTSNNRFCSNNCKSAWRRDQGLDDEDRTCFMCGETYRANRYSTGKTCSRSCRRRMGLGQAPQSPPEGSASPGP